VEALAKYVAGPVALASFGVAIREATLWAAIPVWVLAGTWAAAAFIAWLREVRVRFEPTAQLESLGNASTQMTDGRTFSQLTALSVPIENQGAAASFSAQIRHVEPVKRLEDGYVAPEIRVDEVAWEHSLDRSYLIGWRGRARLKIAYVANDPACFWFWTAKSATWSGEGHGWGWRLVRTNSRVSFDLEVLNETYRKAESRRCHIDFDVRGRVTAFAFDSE